jgi:hypothetical protein
MVAAIKPSPGSVEAIKQGCTCIGSSEDGTTVSYDWDCKVHFGHRWCGGLEDGVPCSHPGCLAHVSHPCEGCGRVGGIGVR